MIRAAEPAVPHSPIGRGIERRGEEMLVSSCILFSQSSDTIRRCWEISIGLLLLGQANRNTQVRSQKIKITIAIYNRYRKRSRSRISCELSGNRTAPVAVHGIRATGGGARCARASCIERVRNLTCTFPVEAYDSDGDCRSYRCRRWRHEIAAGPKYPFLLQTGIGETALLGKNWHAHPECKQGESRNSSDGFHDPLPFE
jgi:hypothetical protein